MVNTIVINIFWREDWSLNFLNVIVMGNTKFIHWYSNSQASNFNHSSILDIRHKTTLPTSLFSAGVKNLPWVGSYIVIVQKEALCCVCFFCFVLFCTGKEFCPSGRMSYTWQVDITLPLITRQPSPSAWLGSFGNWCVSHWVS
jgi:hypothetical protein